MIEFRIKKGKNIYLLEGFGGSFPIFKYLYNSFSKLGDISNPVIDDVFSENDYKVDICMDIIKKRIDPNRDCILIGHSFGGLIAINLCKLNNVKMIFAISAPSNLVAIDDNWLEFFIKPYFKIMNYADYEQEFKPLIITSNKFTQEETQKIYLIHGIDDKTVNINQFYQNKKILNIHDERTLIIEGNHHNTRIKNDVKKYIYEKIEQYYQEN